MPAIQTNTSADSEGNGQSVPVLSRQVTHLQEMFWPTINLVNMGKEICKMSVNEKKRYCATLSNNWKRLLLVLEKLLKEDPTLIDRVLCAPQEHAAALTCNLKKQLGKGQSDGQSEDMGKAAFCVLFSPNLVKSISPSTNQVSRAQGSTFKRLKGMIGLAKLYNLTRVTPAFIAYIAVVVCHSLTTDATFSEICGGFNYGIYYNKICKYLEAPQFAGCAKVLLDWWNMRLFGSYNMGADADNNNGAGTLDALYAEAEGNPSLTDKETKPQEHEDQLGDD
ncbi:hypothetical protein RHS04_08637 [Rhizoctonia solani]|uniref:Uncharacterized protein n=1 Tax=Rhizoctonia solani TaxID=456999 RepID=A0A8H7LJ39_9AGAM|nr:hypothetical protein RHS04_08637 [Rhizoctonia solani]